MKHFFLIVLTLSLAIGLGGCGQAPSPESASATPTATPSPIPTPTPTGWQHVWSDEFDQPDGSVPDPTKWNYSTGGTGWGNAELEYYTNEAENAYIENGMLVIQVLQKTIMGCDYTSARLNTMYRGQWTYGRLEIRAKLPNTQGIWPAFWMMPLNSLYGGWPASGEIDIMEMIGREPERAYATLHYGNPHEFVNGYYDLPVGQTYSDDFHTFALEWEPGEIRWYMDDQLYHTMNQWFTSAPDSPFPAPFNNEFYLIINLAVGGNWPGSPDATSIFPQSLYVDYVRVYQE